MTDIAGNCEETGGQAVIGGCGDADEDLIFLKSHVKGHLRAGRYVMPYERRGGSHLEPHLHPELNHEGSDVVIHEPTRASSPATWDNPSAVATFVPHGDAPLAINGVALRAWRDAPTTTEGWDYVDGIKDDLAEPPMVPKPGKSIGAGVVIEEPDGRVWLCAPTNKFGGYHATFPKGTAEPELSLQANALKEAFEETGLRVKIVGIIGDFERSTSVARMYRAVRVGGTPVKMGWESQAVHLCPRDLLYDLLNGWADHPVAEAVGAGPAPKKPEPSAAPASKEPSTGGKFGGLFGKYP